jgi:superfamily II DNA or RNA helicase
VKECVKGIKATGFSAAYWRVSVSGDTDKIPCRDKRAAKREQKKRHLVHGIKIEAIGEGDYYGFGLDGPDRLFLLADFTVTHNTYIGLYLIKEALDKGKKTLFVCDRKTLIEQTSRVADSYGLHEHGVIQAQHWRNNTANFQICSAQTLAKRGWPPADVLIIDEAHTQMKIWTHHIPNIKSAVIGLSATPFSAGLGKLFTNLVNAETMHQLTEDGILVPMRILTGREVTHVDMRGAATKSDGEWTDDAATERGMRIIGDVVTEWAKHAEGLKTICFGATINHCEAIARQFNEAGIWAATFTQRTTDKEREQLLAEFRKEDSELKVLVSVEALAKGFDCASVSAIIDVRPLRKSFATVIQMWGRGLRSHPGKKECVILDHSGNAIRFCEDFESFFYHGLDKLDDGKKLEKKIRESEPKDAKSCPRCGATPFFRRCVSCGYQKPLEERLIHAAGEMVEFKVGKHSVERKDLWIHCLTYRLRHGKVETAEGSAAHLFKSIAGVWPPKDRPGVNQIPEIGEINPAVVNKAKQNRIAWNAAKAS